MGRWSARPDNTTSLASVLIRRESPADGDAIRTVHLAAFDRPELDATPAPEAGLVDDLRAEGDSIAALSLVAEVDRAVAGHVVCSRATIAGGHSLGLGPIGVHPSSQREGVGSALMHAVIVIAAADALDEATIVLLGHPEYYPRFGFEPAVDHGITPPGLGPLVLHGPPAHRLDRGPARPFPLRPRFRTAVMAPTFNTELPDLNRCRSSGASPHPHSHRAATPPPPRWPRGRRRSRRRTRPPPTSPPRTSAGAGTARLRPTGG